MEGKLVKLSGSVFHPACFTCKVRMSASSSQEKLKSALRAATSVWSGFPSTRSPTARCTAGTVLRSKINISHLCLSLSPLASHCRKHAAVCSVCRLPILPRKGEAAASRLRALGRDFHPHCFRCEVGLALSFERRVISKYSCQ